MTHSTATAPPEKEKQRMISPNQGTKGTRALHVPIPEETYWHLREMALQSRLPFKQYMARFLEEAWPYKPEDQS